MATKTNQFESRVCLFQKLANGCNAARQRVLSVWLQGGGMHAGNGVEHVLFLKKSGLAFPELWSLGKKILSVQVTERKQQS